MIGTFDGPSVDEHLGSGADVDGDLAEVIARGVRVRVRTGGAGEGDVVRFRGYLVRIDGENGWSWHSSLSSSGLSK